MIIEKKNRHWEIEVRHGDSIETLSIGAPSYHKAIDKAVLNHGISTRQIITCTEVVKSKITIN